MESISGFEFEADRQRKLERLFSLAHELNMTHDPTWAVRINENNDGEVVFTNWQPPESSFALTDDQREDLMETQRIRIISAVSVDAISALTIQRLHQIETLVVDESYDMDTVEIPESGLSDIYTLVATVHELPLNSKGDTVTVKIVHVEGKGINNSVLSVDCVDIGSKDEHILRTISLDKVEGSAITITTDIRPVHDALMARLVSACVDQGGALVYTEVYQIGFKALVGNDTVTVQEIIDTLPESLLNEEGYQLARELVERNESTRQSRQINSSLAEPNTEEIDEMIALLEVLTR